MNKRTIFGSKCSGNISYLVLVLQLLGFSIILHFYYKNGYLPSPFHYDKNDTFMDFFNTLYWSFNDGRYSVWKSVYPPLVFLFQKAINITPNVDLAVDAFALRDIAIRDIWVYLTIYLLVPLVVVRSAVWENYSWHKKLIFYVSIILSGPMLFCLERANLIILAPLFLLLVFSNNKLLQLLGIALLINIKPYFAILGTYYLLNKDYSSIIKLVGITSAIFISTALVLDSHAYLFFYNILGFANNQNIFSVREVLQIPSSISAFSYALRHEEVQLVLIKHHVHIPAIFARVFIEFVKWSLILISFVILFMKSNQLTSKEIFVLLIVLITNLGVSVGGYSLILYMVIWPYFQEMKFRKYFNIIAILLCINLITTTPLVSQDLYVLQVFLSGLKTKIQWSLTISSVLYPVLNFLLLFLMTMEIYAKKYQLKYADLRTLTNNSSE